MRHKRPDFTIDVGVIEAIDGLSRRARIFDGRSVADAQKAGERVLERSDQRRAAAGFLAFGLEIGREGRQVIELLFIQIVKLRFVFQAERQPAGFLVDQQYSQRLRSCAGPRNFEQRPDGAPRDAG